MLARLRLLVLLTEMTGENWSLAGWDLSYVLAIVRTMVNQLLIHERIETTLPRAKELRKLAAGRKGLTRIVYGGSAGPGTFAKIAEGVDGLFLGRFAHDINNLKKVIAEVGGA